jgi:hypothetical protein
MLQYEWDSSKGECCNIGIEGVFVMVMKLDDDILLETVPLKQCNYKMAMYTMHLATGSNLHHIIIKSAMISDYLASVAKFLGRFYNQDFCKQLDS